MTNKVKQHMVAQPPAVLCQTTSTMNGNGSRVNSQAAPGARPLNGGSRSGNDRQQVLRHQQQRLLLLRHAAKCPHEDGRCPVTPHCAGMKRLWKHIAECTPQPNTALNSQQLHPSYPQSTPIPLKPVQRPGYVYNAPGVVPGNALQAALGIVV